MKNTFGQSCSLTIFGESHGPAIGAVLDGLAPGVTVDEGFISAQLSKRRPAGKISTARIEEDKFEIVSGVYNGKTTGTPITIVIPNTNVKSSDYSEFSHIARPGHADYTAHLKYHGFEDYRGGGHFSGVKRYMETITSSAETDGYAVTFFGRRRFIPEILSTNKTVKALGKRIAMNMPIQGTAADIIKIAMIRVYKRLRRELPEAKLILQVHDELIVEAPETASQKALQILREEMQGAVELKVPLPVDAKIGKSWYETH